MADGTQKPIRQIKIGDEVITGSHKVRGVTNWMDNGEKEIWLVKAEGLSFVHTTEHHRFWARITDSAKPDWIEACFLTEQSMIATYEKGTMVFRRVTDICNTRKKERVYDITVAEDHSFLADGYVVHNCQDFSREGRNDINTGRSILYERTLQIIDPEPEEGRPELVSRPAVIIWENVPNMANAHPDVLNNYLDAMTGYGYTNTYCGSGKSEKKGVRYDERNILVPHMLKASDYGIPQARDRFFCVSVRNDLADAYGPFVMPAPVPEQYRWKLKDYLDKEAPFEGNEPTEKELSITKEVDGQWYVKQAVQQDYGAGPGYVPVKEYQRVDFAFPGSQNRRGRVGDYAGTLTTSPRQAVLIGGRFRLFTAKEKLRLMGFRDEDYANMVRHGLTDAQISSLAGNSICVPVLEHIFLQLFRQYGEENLKK